MGKWVCVCVRVVLCLFILMIFIPNSSQMQLICQSKQAKIAEIGAAHESAHIHAHELHLTMHNKGKNNEFSIVHFDCNCHETFQIHTVLTVVPNHDSGTAVEGNSTKNK